MKNQAVKGELKQQEASSDKVSTTDFGLKLGLRIKEVIGEESISSFGRRCDVGESTLRKYISGALPNARSLADIADAANVNIEWLAAGRGPKLRGASTPASHYLMHDAAPVQALDAELLARAIGAVEEGLRSVGRSLPPDKHAKLIQAAYNLMGKLEASDKVANQAISKAREQVIQFITLAA